MDFFAGVTQGHHLANSSMQRCITPLRFAEHLYSNSSVFKSQINIFLSCRGLTLTGQFQTLTLKQTFINISCCASDRCPVASCSFYQTFRGAHDCQVSVAYYCAGQMIWELFAATFCSFFTKQGGWMMVKVSFVYKALF